eukprot:366336-Chlamydomonas_euryale.AAC.20
MNNATVASPPPTQLVAQDVPPRIATHGETQSAHARKSGLGPSLQRSGDALSAAEPQRRGAASGHPWHRWCDAPIGSRA